MCCIKARSHCCCADKGKKGSSTGLKTSAASCFLHGSKAAMNSSVMSSEINTCVRLECPPENVRIVLIVMFVLLKQELSGINLVL